MSPAAETAPGLFKPRINSKAHPKVTNEDILAFFQQLSVMFRAGTPTELASDEEVRRVYLGESFHL